MLDCIADHNPRCGQCGRSPLYGERSPISNDPGGSTAADALGGCIVIARFAAEEACIA